MSRRVVLPLLAALLVSLPASLPAGQPPAAAPDKAKLAAGGPETETAIARGLAWLAKQQKADGGWAFDAGAATADRVDATATALLPFLAAGETHKGGKNANKYQKTVDQGVKFLLKLQKADGTFGAATPAGHVRVCLVFTELVRMIGDKELLAAPAEKAVAALAGMANPDGGWGTGGKSDTVTTAWGTFAYASASELGPHFKFELRWQVEPINYLRAAAGPAPKPGAKPAPETETRAADRFAARPGEKPQPNTPATAAGLAARGRGLVPSDRFPSDRWARLLPPGGKEVDAEHLLFAAVVCSDLVRGKPADDWRGKVRDLLLAAQDKADGPGQGGWPADAASAGKHGGRLATTAFALLALEVPFRHLPVFRPDIDPGIEAALPEIERLDPKAPPAVDPGPPGVTALDPGEFDQPPAKDAKDPFAGRTGATRALLIKENGGTEASERAVALGLAWLARQQKVDGSWVYDQGQKEEVAAATGMALLAFLGAGETHQKVNGKYRKTVELGLTFLVKNCPLGGPNAGKFAGAGNMYAQGIATLALCEAYGLTKDKALLAPAQAAVNFIQKGQAADGSWGYSPGTNGDTSILGWQVQALAAARATKDIKVDDQVLKRAVAFLDKVAAGEKKARYGYSTSDGAAAGTSLTAVGLWCRQRLDGWDAKNAGLAEGVEGLLKRGPAPGGRQPDTYFAHYAAQVVRDFGGDGWATWNEGPKDAAGARTGGLRDALVELQVKKAGATLGSWDPDTGFIGKSCGRLGTTALNLVALEVYYRNPPPKAGPPKDDAPKKP